MRVSTYLISSTLGLVTESPLVLAEELAKPFESCKLSAYWDPAGYPTNGWGNLLSRERRSNVMKQLGLTGEQVDMLLQETWPPDYARRNGCPFFSQSKQSLHFCQKSC